MYLNLHLLLAPSPDVSVVAALTFCLLGVPAVQDNQLLEGSCLFDRQQVLSEAILDQLFFQTQGC